MPPIIGLMPPVIGRISNWQKGGGVYHRRFGRGRPVDAQPLGPSDRRREA
jgi:hypothetical protein